MTPSCIYILFLSYHILAEMSDADGVPFRDYFEFPNPHLWIIDHNRVHCPTDCFLSTNENVQYTQVSTGETSVPAIFSLQLWMRHNCRSPLCCKGQSQCALYTSSIVSSRHRYGYGTYTWLWRTAFNAKGNHDSWSCVILHREDDDVTFRISICQPSPYSCVIMVRSGVKLYRHVVRIRKNVSERPTFCRIDWHANSITWYIDNDFTAAVTKNDIDIPNEPLHIKFIIKPFIQGMEVLPKTPDCSIVMHMFMFRYQLRPINHDGAIPRTDELRTYSEMSNSDIESVLFSFLLFCIIFIGICANWYFRKCMEHVQADYGYIKLIEDANG